MADAFAPQLGSEVRFNQPVEQAIETPSMFGALAELGGNFLESFGKSQQSERRAAPKVDSNLRSFREGLDKVEAIRQERGETAALVAERQLASNFAMAGIDFDASYEDVYTKTTGRPWAGYGLGQEGMILQETLKDPAVQKSYIASFAVNKDWNEEQRIEYALGQMATIEAANNEIAKAKSLAGYEWTVNTEAAWSTRIDDFVNTGLGALVVTSRQGGRVSPMDIQNLRAEWSVLRAELSRPSNITDDQWKAIDDKLKNVDNLFTTFEKSASSDLLLETISVGFANAILQEGGDSAAAYGAAMAALKDPTTLLAYLGQTGEINKLMMEIGKGDLRLDVTQPSLFSHILEDQDSLTGDTDPNAFLSTIPSDIKARIEGKTPEQIFNGLNASGKLAGLVKPADLNRPDAREQFVTNAATIGAVLMNNPSEQFLSDAALKQLIANPGFIRNVIALDAIDPEGALVARQYVRSGLSVERGRQVANFGSIEAFLSEKGIVWDGSAYVLTPEAQDIAGAVSVPGNRSVYTRMPTIAGMAPLPMDPLQEFSGVIKQAMDRRAAIGTIDKALKALEVPTAETKTKAGGAGGGSTSTATPIGEALGIDFSTLEAENGLPQGFLERTAFLESGGDPLAQNPESSAGGLFQFIDDTAKAYGVKDRFDPVQATDGAVDVAVDNIRTLTKALGRKPTAAELYLAHQQGAGGAKALLSNTSANVVDALAPIYKGNRERAARAVRLNKGNVNMTAGEFASLWLDRYNNAKTIAPTAGTPANANAVASRAGEAVQRAVNPSAGPASVDVNLSSGGAPTAPMATGEMVEATLPEAIPTATPAAGEQRVSELNPAIAVDPEVQAFIQEIAGDPDKSYETEAEFLAAQERGELEPGDTVVVNGDVYVIRKNGTARRLGTANA